MEIRPASYLFTPESVGPDVFYPIFGAFLEEIMQGVAAGIKQMPAHHHRRIFRRANELQVKRWRRKK